MKLAIAYNTMNKLELTKQSFPVLRDGQHSLLWSDGSTDEDALAFFERNRMYATESYPGVRGGADASIAHSLTRLLQHSAQYTHVGLVEADVMLDADWQEPTMALFEQGTADGLRVGAVSARSYTDRILMQRDNYAVMMNVGAGMIVMTRDAAQIVLDTFRTGYWPSTVGLFARFSGIDLRTYACFRGNEQWTTSDWSYEVQMARMGYATLALTPAKVSMIGQVPSLRDQGLELTWVPVDARRDERAFEFYRANLARLGPCIDGVMLSDGWPVLHRDGSSVLIFTHQIKCLTGSSWWGARELQWSNGFGPFAYRAGEGGMSLSVHISGPCSFLVTGGINGAGITIEDRRSGFKAIPALPGNLGQPISCNVPGGPVPRQITIDFEQGAVFYGLSCSEPQMIDTTFRFDWNQLPKAI